MPFRCTKQTFIAHTKEGLFMLFLLHNSSNLAWQAWKSDFNAILDHHAPIRHMRVRQSSVPWLSFDIKKMMKEQDYHKHAIKYGSHNHWILYQSPRNKVNCMMRKA